MMFLLKKMKKFVFLCFLCFLIPCSSIALNLFEIFMIKTGVAFVYHQYNDKSLNYESELSKKNKILSNFNNNRILTIKSQKFSNLPLQQQLLIIEELNLQK